MREEDQEQVTIEDRTNGLFVGKLYGYDSHGNGRHNKLWAGEITGTKVEFHNLKEIKAWAKQNGYKVIKYTIGAS